MTDTVNFSKDDLVRKIAGLLATAESFAEQGNDDAAQSYVQKAHTLQQKYSIDQAMIAERTGNKVEKIISKKIQMPGKWGKQKVQLTHVIAGNTQCTGYFSTGQPRITNELDPNFGKTDWDAPKVYFYNVFGFESDVEHVEFLINSLTHQMDAALKTAIYEKNSWEHGRSFNASFMQGYINSIGSRLREAARQAQTEVSRNDSTNSVALVLVSKTKQVEQEMRAQIGNLRKSAGSAATSRSGYSAGREAGSRATIARGSVSEDSRGSLGR
jgi:hypothetical protein